MSRTDRVLIAVVGGLCLTLLASRLLPYDVFLALVGVLIGAVISGAISWHFYQQASDDLKDVHDRIVRMLGAISGGTEVKATQDEQRNFRLTFIPTEKTDPGITDHLDVTDSVQVSKPSDEDPKTGG
jgi:ABC-type cobalamin transport system permease subunit